MKIKLLLLSIFLCLLSQGQTPSMVLKFANTETVFGRNLPKGTLLVDLSSGRIFLTKSPLDGSKTISSCISTELCQITGRWNQSNTGLTHSIGTLGIGTASPTTSAKIELQGTTKGFLPPRMTQSQRDLIPNPAEGLMVYNTITRHYNFYDGTIWRNVDGTSAQFVTVPILSTNEISAITRNTASGGGSILENGGALVTERGVCWSTSSAPTISDSHTVNGTGSGGFTSNLTGLAANTTYYVRAYATNSAGTGYGTEISFKTNQAILPTVSTTPVTQSE
jgi:hypothetical protein